MQNLKKSALNLRSLYLILSLTACGGFPERPEGMIYNVNTPEGIAYEFKVPKNLNEDIESTGAVKEIIEMDKYFCVTPEYLLELKRWGEKVINHAKNRCE